MDFILAASRSRTVVDPFLGSGAAYTYSGKANVTVNRNAIADGIVKKVFQTIGGSESGYTAFGFPMPKYPPSSSRRKIVAKSHPEKTHKYDIRLLERLEELNPFFPSVWKGAILALHSDNPDRSRHFSTSIRELFTHLLHTLATDDQIRQWSSQEEYYVDEKPTRVARLQFICQQSIFVDRYLPGKVTRLMKLLNRHTHAMKSHSEIKMVLLKDEAETLLHQLLSIYSHY